MPLLLVLVVLCYAHQHGSDRVHAHEHTQGHRRAYPSNKDGERLPLLPLGHVDGPNKISTLAEIDDSKTAALTPAEFLAEYVHKRKPVILRGAARSAPALRKWTEDSLIQE